MSELGEGEKRLIYLAVGESGRAKVYEEADGSFYVLFTTDDFWTATEAVSAANSIVRFPYGQVSQ